MVTICLQCGDEGCSDAFVFCVKCLNFAVHRYCLDKLPKTPDEYVYWVCDDCEVKVPRKSIYLESECIQLERSDHTNSDYAETSSRKTSQERKTSDSEPDSVAVELTENAKLAIECSSLKVEKKIYHAATSIANKKEHMGKLVSSQQLDTDLPVGSRDTRSTGDAPLKINVEKMNRKRKRKKKKKRNTVSDAPLKVSVEKEKNSIRNSSLIENVNQRLRIRPSKQPCVAYTNRDSNELAELASNSSLPTEFEEKEATDSAAKLTDHRYRCPEATTDISVTERGNRMHEFAPMDKSNRKKSNFNFLLRDLSEQGLTERSEAYHFSPGHLSNNSTFYSHEHAQPVIDPIWRGSFHIVNNVFDGLVAHLSVTACQKAYEAASSFPPLLELEMHPKADVWPKSFQESKPSEDNIALYFFPLDKRYERMFDYLVEEMTCQELAMKAILKNAELLVFTSTELPIKYWRFQGKYYLWGVFRGKKAASYQEVPYHVGIPKNPEAKSCDAESS